MSRFGVSSPPSSQRPKVLFTAFEPSGDDHAAVVIRELKRRHPSLPIFAWGGPKMEKAGATIVERTGDTAVMGVPGVGKVLEHIRMNRRIEEWLDTNRIALHIPVDSPDANFSVCAMAKKRGAKVVHLVAPQLWAWREGRIHKLRRLTDLVLCLLPFEEAWFTHRGVPAKFIGHPLFDLPLDLAELDRRCEALGTGKPRLALMPGSRPAEVRRSVPPLLDAFRELKQDFPELRAVMPLTRAAVRDEVMQLARENGGWPEGVETLVGDTDTAIRWCDFAIVASGTVTLQVARQRKPMVTFYRFGRSLQLPFWAFGRLMFTTKLFTLPNLIAGKRVVQELVPHFGGGEPLAAGVLKLMRQPGYADDQRAALDDICRKFESHHAGPSAADAIEEVLGISPSARANGGSAVGGDPAGQSLAAATQ